MVPVIVGAVGVGVVALVAFLVGETRGRANKEGDIIFQKLQTDFANLEEETDQLFGMWSHMGQNAPVDRQKFIRDIVSEYETRLDELRNTVFRGASWDQRCVDLARQVSNALGMVGKELGAVGLALASKMKGAGSDRADAATIKAALGAELPPEADLSNSS